MKFEIWKSTVGWASRLPAVFPLSAAGRGEGPKAWSGCSKKDFADSDRKMALNALKYPVEKAKGRSVKYTEL